MQSNLYPPSADLESLSMSLKSPVKHCLSESMELGAAASGATSAAFPYTAATGHGDAENIDLAAAAQGGTSKSLSKPSQDYKSGEVGEHEVHDPRWV